MDATKEKIYDVAPDNVKRAIEIVKLADEEQVKKILEILCS